MARRNVVLLLATLLASAPLVGQQGTVAIDDLRGRDYQQARGQLRGRGLQVELRWIYTRSEASANTVSAQTPPPGRQVTRGSTAILVVHGYGGPLDDPSKAWVPQLVRLTPYEAVTALRRVGLGSAPAQHRLTCDQSLVGRVGAQSLPARAVVDRESAVGVTVMGAAGPRDRVPVPLVAGLDVSTALRALRDSCFNVAAINTSPFENLEDGRHGTVDPVNAGNSLGATFGTDVTVVVNVKFIRQVEPRVVPRLAELPLKEALDRIRRAGLNPGPIAVEPTDRPERHGIVARYEPPFAEEVPRNTPVVLTVWTARPQPLRP